VHYTSVRTASQLITVVFITHIDVIDELWVEPQEPFGKVCMYGCGVEKAQMQAGLSHCPPLLQVPAHQTTFARVWVNHSLNKYYFGNTSKELELGEINLEG
jgi:hypothetical protein